MSRLAPFLKLTRSAAHTKHVTNANERVNMRYNVDLKMFNDTESKDIFRISKLLTLEKLFEKRFHWGHHRLLTHVSMEPYIYGYRHDTSIIDLSKTFLSLERALQFVGHTARKGGSFLFMSPSTRFDFLLQTVAKATDEFYHVGTYQEFKFHRPELFLDSGMQQVGNVKRESIHLPDVIILHGIGNLCSADYPFSNVTDSFQMHHDDLVKPRNLFDTMFKECKHHCIPVIALADSDCNIEDVTYPIFGNDDSFAAVEYFFLLFSKVIMNGKKLKN